MEGEEGGVVDRATRLKDKVLKQKIEACGGVFEARDGDVIDCFEEEGDEDRGGICEEVLICDAVGGREGGPDLVSCRKKVLDMVVVDDRIEDDVRLAN